MAKTTTKKMLLNSEIEELRKMGKRHEEYQEAGEDAGMLVDMAHNIKVKLKETQEVEKQLISEFGNLTVLLEMLNLEGEEEDKKKGTDLSNKVNADLTKYKGLVNDFAHDYRGTLTFAIQKSYSQQSSTKYTI